MNDIIRYYRTDIADDLDSSLLISGICPKMKSKLFSYQLRSASRAGHTAIVIDFGRTGDFNSFLADCGYPHSKRFTAGKDNYAYSFRAENLSVRSAISNLRSYASGLGYSREVCSQMTAFLHLISKLEADDGRSRTVGQLLNRFSNQEKLEIVLEAQVRNRKISMTEGKEIIQKYLEYVSSGVTADCLLDELDFIMTPDNSRGSFSLSDMRPGEAAVLCSSDNNTDDLNDHMSLMWTADIIKLADMNMPLLIGINAGHHSQIERMYKLTETLCERPNVRFFYSTYDLFSGTDEERAKAFAKLFRYDLFSSHSNDSAVKISSMFHDYWVTQYNHADAHNKRLMGESLIDKFLGTDHTETITTALFKEKIIPAEQIVKMPPDEFIVYDTVLNSVRTAYA